MSPIKCWDRQDIHKRKNDAEKGGHLPEHVPVPHRWEKAAYCSKSAKRLSAIGSKDVFQVIDIGCQYVPAVFDTSRDAFEKSIFLSDGFVESLDAIYYKAEFQIWG